MQSVTVRGPLGEPPILDRRYSEHFGFTEPEVRALMSCYRVESRFSTMKQWYDGYRFGELQVYNPWSVIKFLYDLDADINAPLYAVLS